MWQIVDKYIWTFAFFLVPSTNTVMFSNADKGFFTIIKALGCVLEMLWHHKYDGMMVKYVQALQA